jgi:hypothetical protein
VPAFEAQVLDVGAGGLRDSQPVEREQGDQRMLERRTEPGGDQHGAEFVAVQRDSMRLVVDPRSPDVGGWRVLEKLFFDRVVVIVVVPISAQLPLCRSADYADLRAFRLLSGGERLGGVGITRSACPILVFPVTGRRRDGKPTGKVVRMLAACRDTGG